MKAFLLFAVCVAASGQTPAQPVAPPAEPVLPASPLLLDKLIPAPSLTDQARKRIEAMSLKGPIVLRTPIVLKAAPAGAQACAIPLLNAIPARSSADYKMRVAKPAPTGDAMGRAVGLPVCQ
jgi:hypothetical protein